MRPRRSLASSGKPPAKTVQHGLLHSGLAAALGRLALQRQQEVAGEVDAVGGPADRAGAVQPDDAEGDGQSAAAFRHLDHVGVGRVVVGGGVGRRSDGDR